MHPTTLPSARVRLDVPEASTDLNAATGERLSRLFSASLKQGRLHPLYMPLLNYRGAVSATP